MPQLLWVQNCSSEDDVGPDSAKLESCEMTKRNPKDPRTPMATARASDHIVGSPIRCMGFMGSAAGGAAGIRRSTICEFCNDEDEDDGDMLLKIEKYLSQTAVKRQERLTQSDWLLQNDVF
jgi:hypothetical protein